MDLNENNSFLLLTYTLNCVTNYIDVKSAGLMDAEMKLELVASLLQVSHFKVVYRCNCSLVCKYF